MAVVQSSNKKGLQYFSDLAKRLTSCVFSGLKESNHVAIVPDRYDNKHSIKTDERSRRQSLEAKEIAIESDKQRVPKHFQQYLNNPCNKINLVNFIFKHWKQSLPQWLNTMQYVYLANLDGTTDVITKEGSSQTELQSDHEEADSKMFGYSKYIIEHNQIERVVIHSPETDVAVICCFQFATSLATLHEMWFKTGVGNKARYIPIHTAVTTLGTSICRLLPGLHSITGCDSVSSFSGIGKKKSFGRIKEKC